MEKEQKAILETIDIIIKKRLNNLGFNYYVDGVITTADFYNNLYTVLINGVQYQNVSAKHKMAYQVNDTVRVLIKNGNWQKKFIDGMSYNTKFLRSQQYHAIDSQGEDFPAVCYNGTNLWIGSFETATRHHTGGTYLSSGYDTANKKGHETIRVSVPNETNTGATNYPVMHSGNLNNYLGTHIGNYLDDNLDGRLKTYLDNNLLNRLYPVGSICIRETKSDPVSTLKGTWTLVDKEFKDLYITKTDQTNAYFTPNSDVISACEFRVSRAGHSINIKLYLTLATNAVLNDDQVNLGTLNYKALGIERTATNRSFPVGYSDGGGAIIMGYLYGDTGQLVVLDIVKKYSETDANKNTISGTTLYFDFTETIPSDYMLDSACSKFYWKRKA